MIPKDCKRLAEVDFPIAEVSRHAVREKNIRRGHPSTLHIWWARRPLASSRAVLLALLWPDPCDPLCPAEFKEHARKLLRQVPSCNPGPSDEGLRKALLKFIGNFANWDLASSQTYLEASRGMVKAAYGDDPPLVVDPFGGGGSIPLEALRVGCDAFASDLNPVSCLFLHTLLESIPRFGADLEHQFRSEGARLDSAAEKQLEGCYPREDNGSYPFAFHWARTVNCESPNCGLEIPLLTSLWLSKRRNAYAALQYHVRRTSSGSYALEFEIIRPREESEVGPGTVQRARAVCPRCGVTLPNDRIRAQLYPRRSGAVDARMIAVCVRESRGGLTYRVPTEQDRMAYKKAAEHLKEEMSAHPELLPVESLPNRYKAKSSFDVIPYGAATWADLFNSRQLLALMSLTHLVRTRQAPSGLDQAVSELLALSISKLAERLSASVSWITQTQAIRGTFSRQALPIIWDFVEIVPFGERAEYSDVVSAMARAISAETAAGLNPATVRQGDAADGLLPDDSASVWFTDPPYYDNIAYADLSDFFFVWLKRALPGNSSLRDPYDQLNPLTPKDREAIQSEERLVGGLPMDRQHFERRVRAAFAQGNLTCMPDGIACVVFAHKKTEGWEALLTGLHDGHWTITASWPIATERAARLVARQQAALGGSVHLICRRRADAAPIGDWADVLRQLPNRVGDWMERLQGEGVRGADLVFACIGPALEIFSKYSKVETAEGREVALAEYLENVWEAVGRSALAQVLGTAESEGRNGTAAAVEEDARLTALFLWTLQSTNGDAPENTSDEDDEEVPDEEDDEGATRGKAKGFTLIFDVVRRFAQPLGIDLPKWEGRVIEIKKGVVRLLPIAERAKRLFGEDGAQAVAARLELETGLGPNPLQGMLFPEMEQTPTIRGRGSRGRRGRMGVEVSDQSLASPPEATALDRVHAAMLLQASGRTNALRALLKAESERGPDFLRLANALSALYPKGSEEKRLLDAMLLAVPR